MPLIGPVQFLGQLRSSLVSRRIDLAIVGLLCTAVLVQTSWFRSTTSITFDETSYLILSIRSLHRGILDPGFIDSGVAPLPIVLNYFPALGREIASLPDRAYPGLGTPGDAPLIALPRLLTTLSSLVPLVALAYFWLRARRGIHAATFGAGLLAFSPTLLAHASLATHDMTFATHATLALIVMGAYLDSPGGWRLLATALTTSLAISSKYTGLLLVPFFLLLLTVRSLRGRLCPRRQEPGESERNTHEFASNGLIYVLLTFAFTWAFHGFQLEVSGQFTNTAEASSSDARARTLSPGSPAHDPAWTIPASIKAPGFVRAIQWQWRHARQGHWAFLMGRRSQGGWWWYYPLALLLKSTFAELILTLAAIVCLVRLTVRGLQSHAWPNEPRRTVLLLFMTVLLLVLMSSHIDIGQRYAIAIYPVGILWSTDLLAQEVGRWKSPRIAALAAVVLVGAQLVTSLTTAPHYLSYFNRLSGGPERGWEYLVDSNIDWGQDLPALRGLIEREGFQQVACDYFGTASLQDYGVHAEPVGELSRSLAEYDALAISVTALQLVYGPGDAPTARIRGSYRALRRVAPSHRAGHSIFVYDLRSPGIRDALASAIAPAEPVRVTVGGPAQTATRVTNPSTLR